MKPKKIILFIPVFLTTLMLNAQEPDVSNKSLMLRGKAATFFIVEDLFFQNLSLGAEYRFAEKHSVGVDFVHFRWRNEVDIYVDGMETGSGPDAFSRRRYVLIDYRYYPFQNAMQKHYIDPYINPFVKVGERKIWSNDPYTFYSDYEASSVRNQRASYTDYGLACGLRYDLGIKDRFGIDVNLGVVYREARIKYEERYDYSTGEFVERFGGTHHNWRAHMRLNFYVKIVKIQKVKIIN